MRLVRLWYGAKPARPVPVDGAFPPICRTGYTVWLVRVPEKRAHSTMRLNAPPGPTRYPNPPATAKPPYLTGFVPLKQLHPSRICRSNKASHIV